MVTCLVKIDCAWQPDKKSGTASDPSVFHEILNDLSSQSKTVEYVSNT